MVVVVVVFEMLVVVMLVGMLITENICIAPECTSGTVLSTSQILTQRSKSSGSYCFSSHFSDKESIACCALEAGLHHRGHNFILVEVRQGTKLIQSCNVSWWKNPQGKLRQTWEVLECRNASPGDTGQSAERLPCKHKT